MVSSSNSKSEPQANSERVEGLAQPDLTHPGKCPAFAPFALIREERNPCHHLASSQQCGDFCF